MDEPPDKDRATPTSTGLDFYAALPTSADFSRLGDPAAYVPLPDDWVVGVADIVRSTAAIEAGAYKQINTVAAAVIAAIANGLSGKDFPFVFGGDGAGFALPAARAELARTAMAAVAGWASEAFDLTLRIAMVPVATIRANQHDVRVARFSPSPDVAYAMFDGGGLAWAEQRMKVGEYRLEPATGDAARPDLTGLTCRFAEIPASRGLILSIIMVPAPDAAPERFAALAQEIVALGADGIEVGSPVPPQGPDLRWPSAGFRIEAKVWAARTGRALWSSRLSVLLRSFLAHLTFTTGIRVGRFDPRRYRAELVRNTDFRKFDDGLRMTLDCTPSVADRIEQRLRLAAAEGTARIGTHRQGAALMTCFVPSASRSDHVHFIDGATGGYAAAAAMIPGDAGDDSDRA